MTNSVLLAAALFFQPDLEIKINGLVCSSCGIGIKRGFKKSPEILDIKFDTRKQVALIDLKESDAGRVYWIKNDKIIKIVKDAGYEVTSIKRLWNKKPNRYNKP
jgi:cation transport ATPase|tara:strand:- start:5650 stop:5961 length:312 start_codon:yes stop_codon:yes gene_type:complete